MNQVRKEVDKEKKSRKRKTPQTPPCSPATHLLDDVTVEELEGLVSDFFPVLTTKFDDPLAYILDSFDNLIAPQIVHPPSSTPSIIGVRRFLYRKKFLEETLKILSCANEITNIEQLVNIVVSACNNSGIYLL